MKAGLAGPCWQVQKRRIEINGSKGTALLEGDSFSKLMKGQSPKDDDTGEAAGADSPLAGMSAINHQRQFNQILDALAGGGEPAVSGRESLQSLAIIEAIYTSAEKKQVILVDDILKQ